MAFAMFAEGLNLRTRKPKSEPVYLHPILWRWRRR